MIYIKEVLPDPVGRDVEGEWIKLINKGNEVVSLDGWYVKDEGGKTFNLTGRKVNPSGEITLSSKETKISLNNTKDSITLYDSESRVVDELAYDGVSEAEIIMAKQFQERTLDKSPIAAMNAQVFQRASINTNYEWWPLFLGVILSIVAGAISGLVFKKINTPS